MISETAYSIWKPKISVVLTENPKGFNLNNGIQCYELFKSKMRNKTFGWNCTVTPPLPRTVHGVLHHTRDGEAADRLVSLPASSYARDALAVFQDAALILLTDAYVPITPGRGKQQTGWYHFSFI